MVNHIGLVDSVYLKLKEMIFNQELAPGQKILQEKIAAQLGVSRSPLLKALQKLESEFLVENLPRRGMYVKQMTKKEVVDIFQCRGVLEGLSARLAATKITDAQIQKLEKLFSKFKEQDSIDTKEYAKCDRKFHQSILEIGGNEIVSKLELINNIHLQAFQVGLLKPPNETLGEHLGIIEALKKRDSKKCEELMKSHIESSLKAYEKSH
ncbi:MAG: GntR family transcriptional regulator [Cyclobacteriaceae bacterium]